MLLLRWSFGDQFSHYFLQLPLSVTTLGGINGANLASSCLQNDCTVSNKTRATSDVMESVTS